MKLGRIVLDGPDGPVARLVVVKPEQQRVVDLLTAERLRLERQGATVEAALRLGQALFPPSMAAAIALGDLFLEAAARAAANPANAALLPLAAARFLPPIDPPMLRDFSAFAQHVHNMTVGRGRPFPPQFAKLPPYYKGNPTTLIGQDEEVVWPSYTDFMDYELELGFVIGKPGRNLTPEEAPAHLFGLTIINDFSARDIQGEEMAADLGPAKGKDFATAVGPWITTPDELDAGNLLMLARVNGEERSRGSSATMTWKPEELIAYASWGETIAPGELIGSGTVGFGSGVERGSRLQPGDVVELEVPGVGVLRNRLGRPEPRTWTPQPRQGLDA
jgi:2-keto-4-pentenoate hydratase/2-oxohepta-3-ene-1,7-dioic acid hydratase in catechol pathway